MAYVYCQVRTRYCFFNTLSLVHRRSYLIRLLTAGFGIGPKSATVPIYAAECSPPQIRGALVMQWQMWTGAVSQSLKKKNYTNYIPAFGIFVGYASDLVFYHVPDQHGITGLNWRLMMGSACLPAIIVVCFVFLCPESPRWYMSKGRHESE